ncbi:uncharacterized protein [Gossypium hirsutum]|uniref:Integrase catalytic domain-containing protein n=1 Tax=Gossypium hirsutum TaxID=3635 RepID=A0A1U8N6D0_GOSHI|nr:uncharacterized protein LOC107944102 [Gossypium hirsutum]
MSLKSAKEIWDYHKAEYKGDERIRGLKVLNLIRDFELQKMKESESVKEYSDRLLSIANKVRLLGSELNNSRIVEKLLITISEKFEATITTLENTKDLSKISLAELLNALQAQEQRRSMRKSSESWLIDSGCTNHMTYDKELFEELRNTEVKRVRIGNDVLFVPKIDQNLLSVGQLLDKGYKVLFHNKQCLIKDANGKGLFNVKMKGKIFALNPMENEQMTFKSRVSATETWHKRLGHIHHRGLLQMQMKNLVEGLTDIDDDLPHCRACKFGEQHRQPFPKQAWRASKKLQLVFTDLCGPQRTPSLNGNLYYIAFIDDLTRMCWIFLLKKKLEVAGVFWKFKARVENGSGCMIQILRSDNGKEYTSETFNRFCEEAGIEHQLTAPYTPQQNGVSERRNRLIMEMTRCMLHEKNLPKGFWGEVANTAVFLQNRISTKAVKDQTPFEAWYGYKPSLKFLRVFGCLCFTCIPQVKRDKLDKKAEAGIFVGYSTVSKAYRVFQPHTGRVIVSRDIYFVENEQWNWEGSTKTNQTYSAPNHFTIGNTLEELEDEGQDVLADDAPVKGGAFDDREKKTWELVDRPLDRKIIGVRWVFRTKLNPDGSVNKFKARLVLKGYAQVFRVDYSETFALVVRLNTVRLLFALTAQKNWKVFQDNEDKVYLLKKALYGLKQAPRAWNSRIDDHLVGLGFQKSQFELTLYVKHEGTNTLVISVYVDDLLITGSNIDQVNQFKLEMKKVFEMTDLGLMSYFLDIEIKQNQNEVFICQRKYAKEILRKFHMEDCKAMSTPMNQKEKLIKDDGSAKVIEAEFRSLVGCLMYLAATRPDILNDVSILSRFMHCPNETHMRDAKHVLLELEEKQSTEILVDNQAAIAISNNPVFYGKTKYFNIKLFFVREVQKSGDVSLCYCKSEDQIADIFTKPLHLASLKASGRNLEFAASKQGGVLRSCV